MNVTNPYYADLVLTLLAKEFKVRYKSTVLGYAWSILHPLAFAMVFYLVFRVFMRIQIEDYALFLIAGLFPWQWFANSLNQANLCFLTNASLIKKVSFPRELLVTSAVLNDLIHFLLSLPVIVLFLLIYGHRPAWCWLWAVPLLTAIQFALIGGLSLVVATGNVFFRDLQRLVTIGTMIWFYATPVLYRPEMIPAAYRWALQLNPMAGLILCWRGVLLDGNMPWTMFAAGAGWAVASYLVGHRFYRMLQWRLAEIV